MRTPEIFSFLRRPRHRRGRLCSILIGVGHLAGALYVFSMPNHLVVVGYF